MSFTPGTLTHEQQVIVVLTFASALSEDHLAAAKVFFKTHKLDIMIPPYQDDTRAGSAVSEFVTWLWHYGVRTKSPHYKYLYTQAYKAGARCTDVLWKENFMRSPDNYTYTPSTESE